MLISKLKIKNYRNLKESCFEFDKKVNYIYGQNAQGKTNLLEAIWMFTGARSFRKTKDLDLVNFEKDFAKLSGNLFFEGRNQEISINFAEEKRKIFLNGVANRYPTDMIGKFRAVIFTPFHLSLVKDGPDSRRRFLDAAICQLEPSFTRLAVNYSHSLKQRNSLLKQMIKFQKINENYLEVWNLKIAEIGSRIVKMRSKYLSKLKKKGLRIYFEISNGQENLDLKYISSVTKKDILEISEENLKRDFLAKLEDFQEKDLRQGFTSVGPHKDDLEIFLHGKSLKYFGSQGQQRSAVLALKLAESEVLEKVLNEPPVILLDDVMSELDENRQNYVLSKLTGKQVFVTGCDKNLIKNLNQASIFHIQNGGLVQNEK